MERKNKPRDPVQAEQPVQEEEKIRWKKTGGGSFWFGGHIIKPGQIFWAKPSEIPAGFRDLIIPIDGLPNPDQPPIEGKASTFTKRPRPDEEGMFDVVNEKGKPLNKKGLTEEKADSLLQDLQA